MAEAKFVLYIRKFLKNPLLGRRQAVSVNRDLTGAANRTRPPRVGQLEEVTDQGEARQAA